MPFTVVGVAPPSFFGVDVGRQFDVALPIGSAVLLGLGGGDPSVRQEAAYLVNRRGATDLTVMLRLGRRQTPHEGTALLRAAQAEIFDAAFPKTPRSPDFDGYRNDPFALVPAATPGAADLRQPFQTPLVALLGITASVLLIVCGNLACLFLARAAARRHEMGVRCALGASRWRLVRQQVLESLVLAALGGAVGSRSRRGAGEPSSQRSRRSAIAPSWIWRSTGVCWRSVWP